MIAVATTIPRYRRAGAELPARVRLDSSPAAEIAIVSGDLDGLVEGLRAVGRGARVVVIDRPRFAPDPAAADAFAALSRAGASVVLSRPHLRADVVSDAVPDARPGAVNVQVQSPRDSLADALLDAAGWARVLAAGRLALRAAVGDARAVVVDLTPAAECVVTVTAATRMDAGGATRLRATAVAAARIDVVVAAEATVTRATAEGELRLPPRWESPERLALRRALAVCSGEEAADLREWNADAALVTGILQAVSGERGTEYHPD